MAVFIPRRCLALLLTLGILFSCFAMPILAEETIIPETGPAETSQPPAEPTEEPAAPTEVIPEPSTEATEPETVPPEEPTEPEPAETISEPEVSGPGLYFGQLHAHSSLSSGTEDPEALFQSAIAAGLDFFAITDHGDSLEREPARWETGKAAAEAVTDGAFVGIYGYEMNWPERMQIGHISAFRTAGFQSWQQERYSTYAAGLETWYGTLASDPGAIGQWNHPGSQYGTFADFDYCSTGADQVIQLMELNGTEEQYIRALDKGWHIAPTNNAEGRTVVFAQSLTEEALYDAIASRRVYATEDCDLEISYTMNGAYMGSILKKRHMGETAHLTIEFFEPTDNSIGQVDVITNGGVVADSAYVEANCDSLQFSLPAHSGYYYLRITQPDGDTAVTAPIWIDGTEALGISGLSCAGEVPVQGEETSLILELYNQETEDFSVDSIKIYADNVLLAEYTELADIPAGSRFSQKIPFTYNGIGQTELTAVLSGSLDGAPREFSAAIRLSFRLSQQVTDIVVDSGHGNAGLEDLDTFKAMAAEADSRVILGHVTEELLKNCRFLLVSAPSQPFSEEFLTAVETYVRSGGSLLVCGQATRLDNGNSSAGELNRLLEAIGSAIRLNGDTLTDPIHNGGEEALLFPDAIASGSPLCDNLAEGQVYRHENGCSVDPGDSNVLVRCAAGVAAAWEETEAGGTVLVSGSFLPGNEELAEPANIWDQPYANRTIAENLLGIGGEIVPLSTIRQAREAGTGTLLRVRGYVTAGTANVWNRFPDTLYLQDDTGGIAVMPFTEAGIAVGTPVEVTGIAEGSGILKPISWQVLDFAFYRYQPQTGNWKELLDPERHGGELVEVEGECTDITLTGGTVSGITLKDGNGNTAHVRIEDCISSSATGRNDLQEDIHKGDTVRAIGILHVDGTGKTVIRVRNCEEVVYVPPKTEYVNPKTGDWLTLLLK